MDPRRLLPALAAVACACVVLTAVVGWTRSRDDDPDDPARSARRSDVVASSRAAAPRADEGRGPAGVLAGWDRRRAAAWAAGDERGLARLYVDGSRTGTADVRLLHDYLDRGLRVEGLTTQVLALRVVERSAARLVLRTTDRVVGARAVGETGAAVPLPVGLPSTRRVVLVRAGGPWRVAEVTRVGVAWGGAQESAAASTSRTSSSTKS